MGQCYEKMGNAEARKAYERVIAQFSDQSEAVAEARRHLATGTTRAADGPVVRSLLSSRDDRAYGMAVSLDGPSIAFVNRLRIWMRNFATGTESVVVSPASSEHTLINPLISPNGRDVAYGDRSPAGYQIDVIRTDGTGRRTVASSKRGEGNVRHLGWSPDSGQLLVWSEVGGGTAQGGQMGELLLVSIASGSSRVILPRAHVGITAARFSPDGRQVVFQRFDHGQDPTMNGIFLLTLAGGVVTPVAQEASDWNVFNPIWAPDGRRILFSKARGTNGPLDLDLYALQVTDGKTGGEATLVKKNVPPILGVTRDGEYLYRTASSTRDLYSVDVDPRSGAATSRPKQITTMFDNRGSAWSPDGQRLAYFSIRSGNLMSLVIRSDQREERVFSPPTAPWTRSLHFQPAWFPDGRSLLLCDDSGKLGRFDVETGELRPLLESASFGAATSDFAYPVTLILAPDGLSIYHVASDQGTGESVIVRRTLDGGVATDVLRVRANRVSGLSLSPDGSQLSYIENIGIYKEDSSWALKIVPVTGGSPKEVRVQRQLPMREVVWSRDGRRLFYSTNVNRFVGDRVIEEGGEIWSISAEGGEPTRLGVGLQDEYFLNVHPNGRQLIFMDENYRNELCAIRNLFPAPKAGK
jgi:Tol biopolymer transport system component